MSEVDNPPEANLGKEKVELTFSYSVATEKKNSPENPSRKNEDATYCNPDTGTFIVLDGTTDAGDGSGHEASEYAKGSLSEKLSHEDNMKKDPMILAQEMSQMLFDTSNEVRQETRGAAAVVAIQITHFDNETSAVIATAGDCRAYLERDGEVKCLSLDDHFVLPRNQSEFTQLFTEEEEFEMQNKIDNAKTESELNDQELRRLKQGMLNNSLGSRRPYKNPNVHIVPLLPGDRIFMTSDGLHRNQTAEGIRRSTKNIKTEYVAGNLVSDAKTYSEQGNFKSIEDDITAVCIDMKLPPNPKEVDAFIDYVKNHDIQDPYATKMASQLEPTLNRNLTDREATEISAAWEYSKKHSAGFTNIFRGDFSELKKLSKQYPSFQQEVSAQANKAKEVPKPWESRVRVQPKFNFD